MSRGAFLLWVLGIQLLSTGCSVLITGQGKHLDRVLAADATRQSVRQVFGAPVDAVPYQPPRQLARIPELQVPSVWWAASSKAAVVAWGYEDYRYQGIIHDPGAHQEAGMALGLTLGLAEFVMFPRALRCAAQQRRVTNTFRVWYGMDDQCLAYFWQTDSHQRGEVLKR